MIQGLAGCMGCPGAPPDSWARRPWALQQLQQLPGSWHPPGHPAVVHVAAGLHVPAGVQVGAVAQADIRPWEYEALKVHAWAWVHAVVIPACHSGARSAISHHPHAAADSASLLLSLSLRSRAGPSPSLVTLDKCAFLAGVSCQRILAGPLLRRVNLGICPFLVQAVRLHRMT